MKTFEEFEVSELADYELLMVRGGDGDEGEGDGDAIIIPD